MTAADVPEPLLLEAVAVEIEAFVGESGWDRKPTLFALVPTHVLAKDPEAAAVLGTDAAPEDIPMTALTPIAQDELPEGPLDEALAQIGWPPEVVGCALSQEIVMLPPGAESSAETAEAAAAHPERREARLVAVVLRDGRSASVLRLRSAGADEHPDDILTGSDLAPNLQAALAATLVD
jgi:hypothetical protein